MEFMLIQSVAHPSLPNYLALTGGSTFGVTTDCTDCFQLSSPLPAGSRRCYPAEFMKYPVRAIKLDLDTPVPYQIYPAGVFKCPRWAFVLWHG